MIKVVIADDHYLVREGARQLLEASGEVEVLSTVEDGVRLEEAVDALDPDAVLVDIRMPPSCCPNMPTPSTPSSSFGMEPPDSPTS